MPSAKAATRTQLLSLAPATVVGYLGPKYVVHLMVATTDIKTLEEAFLHTLWIHRWSWRPRSMHIASHSNVENRDWWVSTEDCIEYEEKVHSLPLAFSGDKLGLECSFRREILIGRYFRWRTKTCSHPTHLKEVIITKACQINPSSCLMNITYWSIYNWSHYTLEFDRSIPHFSSKFSNIFEFQDHQRYITCGWLIAIDIVQREDGKAHN